MIKNGKRDWKLPNTSYFTYTIIVQPNLQANNLFYKPITYFTHFWVAVCFKSSKFEAGKRLLNDTKNIKKETGSSIYDTYNIEASGFAAINISGKIF